MVLTRLLSIKMKFLGKPVDEQDSFRMLKALQGSTHQVYSGVACVDAATGKQVVSHRVTHVKMKSMSDDKFVVISPQENLRIKLALMRFKGSGQRS